MTTVNERSVRETLTAEGCAEWERDTTSGFHLGEGDKEVSIEYRRGPDAMTEYTAEAKARELAALDRYNAILADAGYDTGRAWATHGDRLIVIPKPGYYLDERGMSRRQHDLFGGPRDEASVRTVAAKTGSEEG